MRNPQLTSIVPYRRAPVPGAMEAAFAEFLRVDVASGDASLDTIEHYLNEVEYWVAWCAEQGFDPATITTTHIKRYRQALIEANYNPVTTRWKLMVVRRFYEAARNAGLRLDNPVAGVKGPRIRHATEDFKYLSEEELSKLLSAIPDPAAANGWDKLRRMRNQLMVGMMALQALRTIEVQRANVEDLTEKGEHLVLLVRGKTKDRIAYMRPDMAASVARVLDVAWPHSARRRGNAGVQHNRPPPAPSGPPPRPLMHGPMSSPGGLEEAGHLQPRPAPYRRNLGLLAHRRPAHRAGLSGPRRPAHDLALRARGGHGQAESGAVHSGEGGVTETPPALESHRGVQWCNLSGEEAAQEGSARGREGENYRIAMQARIGRPSKVPQLTPAPLAITSPNSTARPGEKCWPPSRSVPRTNIERPATIPRRRSRNPITGRNDNAR